MLPLAAALAIVLLIFAAVSAPVWFDRDKPGFAEPTLDAGVLGLVTGLIVPVQLLLIAFAMSGFRQAWNVEVEHPVDEPPPERGGPPGGHRRRGLKDAALSRPAPDLRCPCPPGWRNGRLGALKKPCPCGVRVRIPPRA